MIFATFGGEHYWGNKWIPQLHPIGFISDGGHLIINNEIVRSAVPPAVNADPTLWRILYPKVFMVQAYADSIIN